MAASCLRCSTRVSLQVWYAGLESPQQVELLVPNQGSNPSPVHWEGRFLITEPPGKPLDMTFLTYWIFPYSTQCLCVVGAMLVYCSPYVPEVHLYWFLHASLRTGTVFFSIQVLIPLPQYCWKHWVIDSEIRKMVKSKTKQQHNKNNTEIVPR